MKILKQVLGIDVAKDELVVCLGRLTEDLEIEITASGKFSNNKKEFVKLFNWCNRMADKQVPVHYVMEATGVYHENFAYFLADKQCKISIVLPNKISNYHRTLDVKTVTDKTSAETITRFGLGRKVDVWKKPDSSLRSLRQLVREREQIVAERTMVKNQLHAEKSEAFPHQSSLKRFQKRLALLDKQEEEVRSEVQKLVAASPYLRKSIELLMTIPGIGFITAAAVLGETCGFDLIRNRRQITSYAGLDVREKQSGKSVRGKPAISKRGNKNLRKALYLPALSAKRNNGHFKAVFNRIFDKTSIKMKGVTAIQRRLLELMYTVYKTERPYDPQYELTKKANQKEKATSLN